MRQQSVGRQMIKVQSLRRIGKEEENVEEKDDGDGDVGKEEEEEEGTDFQKNECEWGSRVFVCAVETVEFPFQ